MSAGGHVGSMKPKLTLKQACFQGYPESAVYVQIPVGSRNSASRNAYHTSLRPSSSIEPRYPSLKVVNSSISQAGVPTRPRGAGRTHLVRMRAPTLHPRKQSCRAALHHRCTFTIRWSLRVNDPSAGSPTETLLRLLLPLSDKVH